MSTENLIKRKGYSESALDAETIHTMIAERAYLKAKKRNFAPGFELEDWLEAEKEIKNQSFYWQQG